MKLIVKSLEGIEFAVETDQRAVPFEIAFAKARPAAELEQNEDFVRLFDVGAAAPEFVFEAPRIASPLERRAAFKVIKGGKV